jgi:hypothetical protein
MSSDRFAGRAGRSFLRLIECCRNEPWLAFELLAWRLLLPFMKRFVPVPLLAKWMWSHSALLSEPDRRERTETVCRLASKGGRLLLSANCYERSLVLYRLLSRVAAKPTLVLGVKSAPLVTGHAWVELGGEPIGEDRAGDYERLIAIGAGGRVSAA